MATDKPDFLRIERRFDAAPERVFDAWLAPEINSQWLFTSGGERIANEIDARVGGSWLMTDRHEGTDYTAYGKYLEIARPKRLVFTFAIPQYSPNSDCIRLDIKPDGKGAIQTLLQEGIDIAEELSQLDVGQESESGKAWNKMFDVLERTLKNE